MNKLKILENTAIHCSTKELAKQVFRIFRKLGFTWKDGNKYNENETYWNEYKEYTCYVPNGGYAYEELYKEQQFNIIEAEDFIKLYNMEKRSVLITIKKAKEWYNSSSTDLREIALQAYTEEELTTPKWKSIKTFKDACDALNISDIRFNLSSTGKKYYNEYNHLDAILKLDIIRRALNQGWNPKMTEGDMHYPYIRFYPAGKEAREAASSNNWKLGESFIADGKKYTLVGGVSYCYPCDGLASFGCGYGAVLPSLGLLGCKSREIAEHMSRYFSKEIFEATYAHHIGTYQWV